MTLLHLRNISGLPWWKRLVDRSAYYETELIQNVAVSAFEPDFLEHDIWFLNEQARDYCEHCNAQLSSLYPEQMKRIRELFSLVPEQMRANLKWTGP